MSDAWDGIKDALISTVRDRIGKFLDENKDAAAFLEDRAKRLAKLLWAYTVASDEDSRKVVMESMGVVRQTIENEISTVAVKANAQARTLFETVLKTAFDALVKTLPAVVGAL